ncbi:CesT family type III secretion system chaperone [Ramlibacter sp. AN1015]|uniref:CesT family type III secretion system chaperone n=1 Tax=Ramlibacter sp. AN1015 TaxID=3133428 RepID=UPI0030BBF095
MINAYNELIRTTAVRLELDPDTLVATQGLLLGELAVGLLYEGDDEIGDIVYFCTLGRPDAHRETEVYAGLLEANTLWVGTGGATLALHRSLGIDVGGPSAGLERGAEVHIDPWSRPSEPTLG